MGDEHDRPPLPWDLASAITCAGVDPSLPRSPLLEALRSAIADRGGYFSADEDERGWVVSLLRPEPAEFRAVEPDQALAWCLVYLMLDELRGADLSRPT
jgi:hypothetical protein